MANFTKRAIKASFMKLLNDQPLSKISVRNIVEDCGINRNSFYYHYQDIPALIEEIITEIFDNLIEEYPDATSIGELFGAAADYALKNKKALLHIYNSVSRDVFEAGLYKFSEYAVTAYVGTAFSDGAVPEDDRNIIVRFVKCELFGTFLAWLNEGLPEDAVEELHRMLELCHGLPDELIRRSRGDNSVKN